MVNMDTDKKEVLNEVNYQFYASPSGRVIATRIRGYKYHIVFLYGLVGSLLISNVISVFYICKFIREST